MSKISRFRLSHILLMEVQMLAENEGKKDKIDK